MEKSPGKWIKSAIIRKKSLKSRPKSTFKEKAETEKEASITSETSLCDWAMNASITHDVAHCISYTHGENSNRGVSLLLPHDAIVSPQKFRNVEIKKSICLSPTENTEVTRQDEAATKAQEIFRGYLARCAFRALKGIIRLQALIRGNLVRRQAVATLHCMRRIIWLQAIFRGRRVRLLDAGPKGYNSCRVVELSGLFATRQSKLLSNAFVCKLLASLTSAIPLHLHYDPIEPNSAWNWLERWSSFRFWEPLAYLKKVPDSKFHTKQEEIQRKKTELGMPNQVECNLISEDVVKNSPHSTLTDELLMHNMRKALLDPQNEQKLRVIVESSTLAPDLSKSVSKKPKLIPITRSSSLLSDATEKEVGKSFANTSKRSAEVSKSFVQVDFPLDDHVAFQHHACIKAGGIENITLVDEGQSNKEGKTSKNWNRGKTKSIPVRDDNSEIFSQKRLRLPNYMAATESAKVKLKGLGSPKFGQRCNENNSIRRLSLPSLSQNSCKLSSRSSRIQWPVSFDKSVLSSTASHGKGSRPVWKR